MAEMHLTQSRFLYSTCGPFIKSKEKYKIWRKQTNKQKKRKQEIQTIFIKANLNKACLLSTWYGLWRF